MVGKNLDAAERTLEETLQRFRAFTDSHGLLQTLRGSCLRATSLMAQSSKLD